MVLIPVFLDHPKCGPGFIVSELIFYASVILTIGLAIVVNDNQFSIFCAIAVSLALVMQIVITVRMDKNKSDRFKLFKYMMVCQWAFILATVFFYNNVAQQSIGDYYTSQMFYEYYPIVYFMFVLTLVSTALFLPQVIKRLRQDNVKKAKFSYAVMRLVNRIDDEKGKSHTYKGKDFKNVRKSV